jgi:predicted GTPase
VQQQARDAAAEVDLLEHPDQLQQRLFGMIQEVAQQFHHQSSRSLLEVPLPALLRILEQATQELRRDLERYVPAAHLLTLHDLVRSKRLFSLGNDVYALYRVLSFSMSPHTALLREVQSWFSGEIMRASQDELRSWLLEALFQRVGFYAVELYSGSVLLREERLLQYQSAQASTEIQQQQARTAMLESEPLRVLVLGQVKAGKSSLINALFGELKAATDVLPVDQPITPYLLERDNLPQALILDSAGLAQDAPIALHKGLWEAVQRSDILIWVCAANQAARQPDHELLRLIRERFQQANTAAPVLIVALNKIDQLRPAREWEPPYNIEQPTRPKEQNLRQALQVVADDLAVPLECVVPVCLESSRLYNVQEALIPTILGNLEESQRHKYLRCLQDFRDQQSWEQTWEQARQAGRFVAAGSLRMVRRAAHTVATWEERLSK